MRLLICLLITCITSTALTAQEPVEKKTKSKALAQTAKPTLPTEETTLKTPVEKMSYAIGMSIGRNIKQQGLPLNVELIALGITTILEGNEPLINREQIQQASQELDAMMEKEALAIVEKFLAGNAKKKGVKTTKSGLQYLVVREGTGAVPTKDSKVKTHYRGTLMDGKMFDQSYAGETPNAADKPVSFEVGQVIPGWTEALQLMKVGAKYRLFIPPGLAYGKNGPPSIGPNKLLIFDIELLGIE